MDAEQAVRDVEQANIDSKQAVRDAEQAQRDAEQAIRAWAGYTLDRRANGVAQGIFIQMKSSARTHFV